MEKCKAFWHAFLHWPGWTAWLRWGGWKKMARWSGWTAWLHWSGWKKIGSWSGWKKLLFPHPVLVVLLTAVAAAGLCWVFLMGNEESALAYFLYCVAFYALVTLCALLWKVLPTAKNKMDNAPLAQKLRKKNGEASSFGIGIYIEQFVNFVYGTFKIVTGVIRGSAWIGTDGIYNLVHGLIQLYQIVRHKKTTDLKGQWKAYRQCGFMLIVLHLTMTGMVYQMIHMGRHRDSNEIMIIATATFTFYKLINRIITVVKDRKHEHPVESAVNYLNFAQALYNLFVLQVGLLWVFGGTDFGYQKLMNSLTGGVVCTMVCGMGFYMIWRANRDMKKWEEA